MNPDRSRLLGSLYGHLCGDACGVAYEFIPAHRIPAAIQWGTSGTHDQPPGTWSDDGALLLCTVASYLEQGRLAPEDLGRRFVRWYDEGYMAAGGRVFDIGTTTMGALARLRDGVDALEAGQADEASNGNGSLMRILPVALYTRQQSLRESIGAAHDASRITHRHRCAQVCCAVYTLIVRQLLETGDRTDALERAFGALDRFYANGGGWGEAYRDQLAQVRAFNHPHGSGFVVDTLWSAWIAFRESSDYVETIDRAIRYGDDTDTTACVAGGLAGLYFGLDAIPPAWREQLRLDDELRALLDRFAELCEHPGPLPTC